MIKISGKDIKDGFDFETIVVGYYQSKGYFAVRSHMSRGPVDVVAMRDDKIRLVQCKLNRNFTIDTDKEYQTYNKLKELEEKIDGAQILYAFYDGTKPVFYQPETVKKEEHLVKYNYICKSCGNEKKSAGEPYKCECGSKEFNYK